MRTLGAFVYAVTAAGGIILSLLRPMNDEDKMTSSAAVTA